MFVISECFVLFLDISRNAQECSVNLFIFFYLLTSFIFWYIWDVCKEKSIDFFNINFMSIVQPCNLVKIDTFVVIFSRINYFLKYFSRDALLRCLYQKKLYRSPGYFDQKFCQVQFCWMGRVSLTLLNEWWVYYKFIKHYSKHYTGILNNTFN